ncbi:hypothetical protein GCM10027047_14460 [Rhodococcus aerolatus]
MTQPNPADRSTPARETAPRAAARFAATPRPSGPAPGPAASLRRRIDGRISQARSEAAGRPQVLTAGIAAAVYAALLGAGFAGGLPGAGLVALAVAALLVTVPPVLWRLRGAVGLDIPTRELRRRASAETRTAHAVEPLESAGWVLLHDRLVRHERVPHILVGPPGVLVLHPHSFGRLAP